jgi:thiamine biosynthesis protein ThiS
MKIIVNGQDREVQATQVEALVAELGLPLAAALVEHNGLALLRPEWPQTDLREGDRLEIIRLAAGG